MIWVLIDFIVYLAIHHNIDLLSAELAVLLASSLSFLFGTLFGVTAAVDFMNKG